MMQIVDVMLWLIRAEICGEEPKGDVAEELSVLLQSEESIRQLYQLSKRHDMVHIVADALEKQQLVPQDSEWFKKFKKQKMLAVYRYEGIAYEYEQICHTLTEAKISYIPLKGSVIRAYYPAPWMRTSCDIDILVHEEDLEQAAACLVERLQYRRERTGNHDVSLFAPGGVHLELHYSLNEPGFRMIDTLTDIWGYAHPKDGDPYCYEMTDEAFYFHHVTHMAKHFDYGGCGIRPFLDLWLLDRRVAHDRQSRDALLEKEKLLKFANTVRQLADVWFGGAAHSDITRRMECFVLYGGVYGNVDNRVAVKQLRRGGKLRYFLSRLFLSYPLLCVCYPALKKHRWLMPYYQVRRWCRIVFKGGLKHSVHELAVNHEITKEEAESTAQFLSDVGLS